MTEVSWGCQFNFFSCVSDVIVFSLLCSLDLKTALGKKRKDGKSAPLQPLTTIQRVHVGRLIEKYGDDYEVSFSFTYFWIWVIAFVFFFFSSLKVVLQRMFMDTKLNSMQHSAATLEKLCKRYHSFLDKNPLILIRKKWMLHLSNCFVTRGENPFWSIL